MILDIFWIILIFLLFLFGIYTSKKISYKNYNIFRMFKSFKDESKLGLFMTLGTKIGVGSIIGTTAAIYIGGAGSLFWMWIFSFFTSSLIYLEVIIGGKYKEKGEIGFISGPYFIIKNGLRKKYLALLTGIILIITYSFFFLMVQTNTINNIILLNININKAVIFVALLILLLLTITFDLKGLLSIMNILVPIMCALFLIISLYVIFKNTELLPELIKSIFSEAFNLKSFLTGLLIGIKRSIFLNELLVGTTSSTALVESKNDEMIASMQVFGAYFITFIVGTLNSLLVLLFLKSTNLSFDNYNVLINETFTYHLGYYGTFILIVILLLLGVTTIISGIYIGISNLENMSNNKYINNTFKFLIVIFCLLGLFINIDLMWKIIDILLLVLLMINGICLFNIIRRKKNDW